MLSSRSPLRHPLDTPPSHRSIPTKEKRPRFRRHQQARINFDLGGSTESGRESLGQGFQDERRYGGVDLADVYGVVCSNVCSSPKVTRLEATQLPRCLILLT